MSISLNNLISAFSLALDLAERKQLDHSRYTAYIAVRLAEKIGLRGEETGRIFYGAMLHDIGITGRFSELLDRTEEDSTMVFDHPTKGRDIVQKLPFLEQAGEIIWAHHERWDGKGYPRGLSQEEIPLGARIIFLADRMEAGTGSREDLDSWKLKAKEMLGKGKGTAFDPMLVEAGLELLEEMRFSWDLCSPYIANIVAKLQPDQELELSGPGLGQVGLAFAELIDNKSPFTANHSQEVAMYSVQIAQAMGLNNEAIAKLKIGALLHDLGKLAIPNYILDKPSKLTAKEYEIMKTHPYFTAQILNEVEGFEEIAAWASMHHERMDGQGYHLGVPHSQLPLPARIVAVADVFQALTADRPYRKGINPKVALRLMLQGEGHLDRDVVAYLAKVV